MSGGGSTGWAARVESGDAWALAPAPSGLSMVHAAGRPQHGLTALQGLDTLALEPGEWLLVTGAAGGVGGYAVELAVLRGLRVVAQAVAVAEDLLRGFGAEVFVARDSYLADSVRDIVPGGVHGVLDCANLGSRPTTRCGTAARSSRCSTTRPPPVARSGPTTWPGTPTPAVSRSCPPSPVRAA